MTLEPGREAFFPNLNRGEYRVTSDASLAYNCLAWALGDTANWWSPSPEHYWPAEIPRQHALESFRALFEAVGYAECRASDPSLETEKIAIFVDREGFPTHVARQLENGRWTSKLGGWQDIEHQDLRALAGSASLYGEVALIMQRSRS